MSFSRVDDAATREAIRPAFIELVGHHGYDRLELAELLEHAGVERRAFERTFGDLDQCFVVIWEEIKAEFLQTVGAAFLTAESWREGMRAAAWAFCRWLQDDHDSARVFMVELTLAPDIVAASRDEVMFNYIDLIHLGRFEEGRTREVPRPRAEAIMGAAWETIATTVRADRFEEGPQQVPQLLYQIVLPYLGVEAANEELRRGPEDIARYERGELAPSADLARAPGPGLRVALRWRERHSRPRSRI